jgi:hypothetical protein
VINGCFSANMTLPPTRPAHVWQHLEAYPPPPLFGVDGLVGVMLESAVWGAFCVFLCFRMLFGLCGQSVSVLVT